MASVFSDDPVVFIEHSYWHYLDLEEGQKLKTASSDGRPMYNHVHQSDWSIEKAQHGAGLWQRIRLPEGTAHSVVISQGYVTVIRRRSLLISSSTHHLVRFRIALTLRNSNMTVSDKMSSSCRCVCTGDSTNGARDCSNRQSCRSS